MYLLYRMILTVYNFMWLKLNKVILSTSAPYYKGAVICRYRKNGKRKRVDVNDEEKWKKRRQM